MTNAELLAKIKAEIERRYNYEKEMYCDTKPDGRPNDGWAESLAIMGVLEELLSFLSTLESEKPMNPDLEKELARFYLKDLCGSEKDEIPEATLHHNFPIMWDDLRDIARHFAEWGYLRAAEKYNEIEYNRQRTEESVPKDLEEAADYYIGKVVDDGWEWETHDIVEAFIAGAKWQKEQMMKEGVEGYVNYYEDSGGILMAEAQVGCPYHNGDKVRIIIVKK